jgi:cytochrome c
MNKRLCWILVLNAALSANLANAADLATETYRDWVSPTGEIKRPEGFRQHWRHLGSWLVDDAKAPGHGFHDVYAQAEAVAAYLKTGQFPDGAVLVKEIRKIGAGPKTTGPARWATEPAVWFVMVKDTQGRFPGNPHWADGWGWALYEAADPARNVSKGYADTCKTCHEPAAKTDRVYIEGYPTLRP